MPKSISPEAARAVYPRFKLRRGWVLEGAGPARFGWYYQHACKQEFIGRTKADALIASGVLS